MKTLMIEPGGWGGICHYTYNLSEALAQTGTQVKVLTAPPYELEHNPHTYEVDTTIDANGTHTQKMCKVLDSYRTWNPDVIHIQSTFSARKDWLALVACRALSIPTLLTAHNVLPHDESERNALGMRWAYQQLYRFTNHIIAHSEDSRSALMDHFRISKHKISVIPHGNYVFAESDIPAQKSVSQNHLNLDTHFRYLLAFGTIRPYKGTEDLLTAFAQIAGKVEDVCVIIAGKPIGMDAQTLVKQAHDLGIANRVIFKTEYIDLTDIVHYFVASDIAVYPYHAIYQSGALQLAYAFARPVLATQVGAFPETIDEHKNGLLVPPREPEALAQALLHMLCLPIDKLEAMGKHSRHLADTRYAWETIAQSTNAIYHRLANR